MRERDFPKATKASFISRIPKIHHTACGGRVTHVAEWAWWTCDECGQRWATFRIESFTDEQVGFRFHLRGDVDPNGYTLVWKSDKGSGAKYTALVPNHQVDGLPTVKW